MPRGGKREGAGRAKGSATKRKAAVKAAAVAQGITPAEVMQKAMEVHYKARRYDKAAAVAKDLAPYVHPRLSSVQLDGEVKTVTVIEDANWYSNAAHDQAAEGAAAPAARTP